MTSLATAQRDEVLRQVGRWDSRTRIGEELVPDLHQIRGAAQTLARKLAETAIEPVSDLGGAIDQRLKERPPVLALLGSFSSGKTSLLNALLFGETTEQHEGRLFRTSTVANTAIVTVISRPEEGRGESVSFRLRPKVEHVLFDRTSSVGCEATLPRNIDTISWLLEMGILRDPQLRVLYVPNDTRPSKRRPTAPAIRPYARGVAEITAALELLRHARREDTTFAGVGQLVFIADVDQDRVREAQFPFAHEEPILLDGHRQVEAVFVDEADCPLRRIQAFCKILDDKGVYQTDPRGKAAQLRLKVFSLAAKLHPLVVTPDRLFEHAEEESKAEIASELGIPWPEIDAGLYADVMQFQRLESFEGYPDGPALLSRYNVAQLQARLYRAESMTVETTADFKTILRYAKLGRLLHEIRPLGPSRYRITFSGPASILRETRSYGVNFARFLPALLACKGWSLQAVIQTPWKSKARLELSEQDGFKSHLPSAEEFDSTVEEAFAAKFGLERDG